MVDKAPREEAELAVEFSGLILGFCSAALSYMGMSPENQPAAKPNLILAKQNIDILELLQVKTKGNLTADEADLLTQALADLRLKFVETKKRLKV